MTTNRFSHYTGPPSAILLQDLLNLDLSFPKNRHQAATNRLYRSNEPCQALPPPIFCFGQPAARLLSFLSVCMADWCRVGCSSLHDSDKEECLRHVVLC
ncbi:hypothetical protein BaRGS_00006732 [Batillaria attramentaria]|uniref:Uncharacterized protein n=1 Tax=Batillaria attramentaria TaxID=370345 RepID=A0ABD0LQZ2_9CAEN